MLYNASMKKIVKDLDVYRLENRISQENLAKELNVAFSTVNRWFNNRTTPGRIQAYHIRKLLRKWRHTDE
ncbi:MAG TPA: XRE family transcriptional regulator [Firmicutes bacterium]|nr:XRE family transcriptional regulator [Bacillota bacterium]